MGIFHNFLSVFDMFGNICSGHELVYSLQYTYSHSICLHYKHVLLKPAAYVHVNELEGGALSVGRRTTGAVLRSSNYSSNRKKVLRKKRYLSTTSKK